MGSLRIRYANMFLTKKPCQIIYFLKISFSSQPFVTELDLRIASLPVAVIDFLREAMPSGKNDAGEAEYDYERFIDDVFT